MPRATDADTDADYGGADDADPVLDYGQRLGGLVQEEVAGIVTGPGKAVTRPINGLFNELVGGSVSDIYLGIVEAPKEADTANLCPSSFSKS